MHLGATAKANKFSKHMVETSNIFYNINVWIPVRPPLVVESKFDTD